MLRVKTYLSKSTIPEAGNGLFANEFIPKGTIVWAQSEGDLVVENSTYIGLNTQQKAYIDKYAFLDTVSKQRILCGDNGKYMNHSETPNVSDTDPLYTIALVDINKDEEIFCDYSTFDAEWKSKLNLED